MLFELSNPSIVLFLSPTGHSVLLIDQRLLVFGLFCSCVDALLDIKAHTTFSLMGKFWVKKLTEDVIWFLSGQLFRHKPGPIVSSYMWS